MQKLLFFLFLLYSGGIFAQKLPEYSSLEFGLHREYGEENENGIFLNYESPATQGASFGLFINSRNGSNNKLSFSTGLKLNLYIDNLIYQISQFEDDKLDMYLGASLGLAIINGKSLERRYPLNVYGGIKYDLFNNTRIVFDLGLWESKLGINFITK